MDTQVDKADNDVSANEFTSRPYQLYLYEKAIEQNSIIYLPTGTGKTYIAVLLVKRLSSSIQKPYNEGGKRTVFLANTVALVVQQCAFLRRHTGFNCKAFTGDMNVDYWSDIQWREEIQTNQILVMTAQIFLDLLTKSNIQLYNINLIIFDECHRAVKDHPMRQIMQRFEDYKEDQLPRVLGLSASLLNGNIKLDKLLLTLKELEITFQSQIITLDSVDMCVDYAVRPKELVEFYDPPENYDVLDLISNIIKNATDVLNIIEIDSGESINYSDKVFKPITKEKKMINNLNDILIHIEEMGLFGGSKCVLLHLIQLEYLKKFSIKQKYIAVLDYLITQLIKIQKLLNDKIQDSGVENFIEKFSSPKLLKLIRILLMFKEKYKNKIKFCCIIFVQRRFTAKVLYHVLKELSSFDPNFEFLKLDFIVGYNSQNFKNARENLCLTKWNKEALIRFRNGVSNCMIATDVVDEGIDIPLCTLVIRFFAPMDFRGYIQSKGRARHSSSHYVILSPNNNDYMKRYNLFQKLEKHLERVLYKNTDYHTKPSAEDVKDILYKYNIEPYVIIRKNGSKSVITEQNAISIINMYCSNLETSKYIRLAPVWTKKVIENDPSQIRYKVQIVLPASSPLKKTIIGDAMQSIDIAKRAAAMKACIYLYEMGELNDKLLPNKLENLLDSYKYLFPYMENEEIVTNPGNYNTKRRHKLVYPKALYAAYPQPEQQLYLHIIEIYPNYPEPVNDNRHLIFYNLLGSYKTFGILSTKRIPEIPSFPIFMNVGELKIHLKRNITVTSLKLSEIKSLKVFHSLIFSQILHVIKKCMVFDIENQSNSFLIVPVNEYEEIDWETVTAYTTISYIAPSKPLTVKNSEYELALVAPNYRVSNIYIVTQVCEYLKANSRFPTEDFDSYVQYFKYRHDLVIENMDQPMLEVKPISKKINSIKPRGIKAGLSKRKRANLNEDFEEHLVPELCERINFPAVYWLKATALPSILHRISQFLIAEDLRVQISEEAFSNFTPENEDHKWAPFKIEQEVGISETINDSSYKDGPLDEDFVNIDISKFETPQLEIDILSQENDVYSWQKEQEPPDFERCAEKIQLIDIEYYYQFMSSVTAKDEEYLRYRHVSKKEYQSALNVSAPDLKMLSPITTSPSPTDILQSLTTKMSNDVFNFERVETLGDSFLKFAVSLYLFQHCPTYGEGALTSLKGKLVGNLNLYYCGKQKNIPGRMNVEEFSALSNFIAPVYVVDRKLQEVLNEIEVSANFLYEINIPVVESYSGVISKNTTNSIKEKLLEWPTETALHTGMEHFLGIQIVSDKSVADCVEAIIGTYLIHLGIHGALSVVKWFEILPKTLEISEYLHSPVVNPLIQAGNIDEHVPCAAMIEDKLRYKFRNRAFLLQALTHSSYYDNQLTYSYQRLEFLGDAVLDFLLTVYIYETCNNLSPGELTDLRSALVNNTTFACLAVRYGLHTALLIQSPKTFDAIDKFVKFQENRNYVINDELLWILMEEEECNMAEHVDIPKILSDVFESLIGAIFLDSGKNLQTVWNIVYSLMKTEIDLFQSNVPKQPIRLIYETQGINPKFSSVQMIEHSETCMVTLSINVSGQKKYFHGFGLSKKLAKCAASKQALKYLKCKS